MILFKNTILHIFSTFLIVMLILLWEIGEIECKTISKRGIMENINSGIKYAGQMFGINTAADVANLVAKAFAPQNSVFQKKDADDIRSSGYQDAATSESAKEESTLNPALMISSMLRLMGLDTAKLGAIALNGIIMIAQMIGNAFMQNPQLPHQQPYPEQFYEDQQRSEFHSTSRDDTLNESETLNNERQEPRKAREGSPLDWLLENPSAEFTKILNQIRDEKLPDHFIEAVNEMEMNKGDGDCIKILICKSQPFIWGMQKSVSDRIDGNVDIDEDEKNGNRLSEFYKYLPDLNEFKKHGNLCDKKYQNCNLYST